MEKINKTTKMRRTIIFIARETTKRRSNNFYDLDDFWEINLYPNETVRVKGKWYFVEKREKDFFESPKTNIFIKPLRKEIKEYFRN